MEEGPLADDLEIIASTVVRKPHSFQYIREATGLRMTDAEFAELASRDLKRFRLVRFVTHNDEGVRVQPGRPGVALRKPPVP